jgi:type IV pilus assembly protein PilO
VVIERYEPAAAAPGVTDPPEQGTNNQDEAGEGKAQAPPDMKGYEKTAVLLQVSGPYVGVLQFLRAMETLELLVQPSDLELKAVPPETNAEGVPAGPPLTELKLRLSFFDKTTDGDQGEKESVESVPPSRVRAPS